MLVHKLKLFALTCLFLCAIVTGPGYVTHSLDAFAKSGDGEPARNQGRAEPRPPELTQGHGAADENAPRAAPGRMFVVGRVLDPNGKPVPGATIVVHARNLAQAAPYLARTTQIPIGDARADGSGRFRIDAPRTSSSRHEAFGAIALAPGHGAGWVALDPDDDEPTAQLTLRTEQVIHGRLFDLQGRPVPNVTLSVASIRRVLPQAPAGVRGRFDGVAYSWTKINDFPAWPKPMTTDPEGRYTLRGLGPELGAVLTVHNPRFALQRIQVETNGASESKPMAAALVPAQILTGRVTYADTGKGVPHAPLGLMASQGRVAILAEFETDDEGRFRLNPPPADRSYNVSAYPPEGQPYLIAHKRLEWPKGALEQSLDLALPRGVLIHGRVTEEGSGKPVPGASVDFVPRAEPRNRQNRGFTTAADGSFQFGAMPSPGYLFIRGPSDDYVLREIGNRMVDQGEPGGRRLYSHAFRSLDLKPGIGSQDVHLVLRRGATVTGQVVGPDGQPVLDAWIFSRGILDPRRGASGSWNARYHGNVRNGRFQVRGLAAHTETPIYFLEPKRKLGVVVNLSVESAAGVPVTVRLEPCGAAKARVVDPDGKPVVGRLPRGIVEMVVTPGAVSSTANNQTGLVTADLAVLNLIDTVNYESELVSDAQGRLALPVLIPGATYRFVDYTMAVRGKTGPQLRKDFTVKPGEILDLGDIVIEKPQAP